MPTGSEDEGDDVIFLSPDESPQKSNDQGASPQLRRSNRKRKSVSTAQDMTRGSGSKKKKCSPIKATTPNSSQGKAMPKVPRTPPKGADGQEQEKTVEKEGVNDFVALLQAMEARLSSKLDANKKAVNEAVKLSKLNSDALDALEEKVDATDETLRETLARVEAQEERVLARVESQVKIMVQEQLKAAGFDSQLSAGDLSSLPGSYAAAVSTGTESVKKDTRVQPNKDQRQEAKFWECRRSLRLWPVKEATESGVKKFLTEKLSLNESFTEEDMGPITIKRNIEKKPKNSNEVCVIFDTKQIRDTVKAQGPNLANHREDAGMRLQIPDNLQKDFKALMSMAYELKQKNKDLKRNVKFDEESLGLFMDVQMKRDGDWKRIRPSQAHRHLATRQKRTGPDDMGDDEIESLLGEETE